VLPAPIGANARRDPDWQVRSALAIDGSTGCAANTLKLTQQEFPMGTWTLKPGSFSLFEFLHRRRPLRAAAVSQARARPALTTAPVAREVSERRAAEMRRLFPKLSAWFARASYMAEMREVDRYLSQATNIFDLEQRIRRIERQGSASRWY
jgi:hypothetical protein